MKEYYPSKKILIAVFIPLLMLFLLAFSSFNLTNKVALLSSLILFGIIGLLIFFLYKYLTQPILKIGNNKILVSSRFLNKTTINVKQCKLVISNDYLAFREPQKQDVSIGKDDIPKNKWPELLKELQNLPFQGVIK